MFRSFQARNKVGLVATLSDRGGFSPFDMMSKAGPIPQALIGLSHLGVFGKAW